MTSERPGRSHCTPLFSCDKHHSFVDRSFPHLLIFPPSLLQAYSAIFILHSNLSHSSVRDGSARNYTADPASIGTTPPPSDSPFLGTATLALELATLRSTTFGCAASLRLSRSTSASHLPSHDVRTLFLDPWVSLHNCHDGTAATIYMDNGPN